MEIWEIWRRKTQQKKKEKQKKNRIEENDKNEIITRNWGERNNRFKQILGSSIIIFVIS